MATGGVDARRIDDHGGSEDLEDLKCVPCHEDGDVREAVGLCLDCQEYLCQRCYDSHMVPKPMRSHQLLDKQEMMKSQIRLNRKDKCTERCPRHDNEIIKYYCTHHSKLGCGVCLKFDHSTCNTNVLYIPDVAKDLKLNKEYVEVDSQLKLSLQKSKKVNEAATKHSETVESSYTDAMAMIKDIKKKYYNVWDRAESQLANQVESKKESKEAQLVHITSKCKNINSELQTALVKIEALQKSNQSCNSFIEMMKLKARLKFLDSEMGGIQKELPVTECEFRITANQEALDKLDLTEFAKLTVADTEPQSIETTSQPQRGRRLSAKAKKTTVVGAVCDRKGIKVESETDGFTRGWISGLVLLPDQTLVLVESNNNKIKTVDTKQRRVTAELKISCTSPCDNLWDIAVISETQVAVTLITSGEVLFVNVSHDLRVERKMYVGRECYGIDYKDGKLAVSITNPDSVKVLNLQGVVLYNIINKQGSAFYLSFGLDSTTLYVSNNDAHNFVCMRLDGSIVAIYREKDLKNPCKAVVDSSGTVYLCSKGTSTIHQLTPDCKRIKLLMTPDQPHCIAYSELENKFYVGKNEWYISVYTAVLR